MSANETRAKSIADPVGIVVGAVVVVVFVAMLYPVLSPIFTPRDGRWARQVACMSSQKQIMAAMLMYGDDYDGRPPPASHWSAFLVTYLKADREQVFRCPSARHDGSAGYDYAFNPQLTGKDLPGLADAGFTVAVFDAEGGQLALRHREGANITYADGHAKWSRPTRTHAGWVIEGRNRRIPVPVGVQAGPVGK